MGVSTDGQLSFGVVFDEGYEFPWDAEPFNGNLDDWWLSITGFVSDTDSEYYSRRFAWLKANPVPVVQVNYCSGEYPLYLLATKHFRNCRGTPESIDIESLGDIEDERKKLLAFLEAHRIKCDSEPKWWLTSYWG